MFVLTFGNLVLAASNLSYFNSLNRVIIKYYDTLFALKAQNCLDRFTYITALSNVFGLMAREFVFVLIQITVWSELTFDEDLCHVETIQMIFIAMQLFGFYMTQDIEGNYRTFCGFIKVNLFAHLCYRLIEVMSMVFFFYLTCCLITVQECVKLFRFKDAL